MCAYNYKHVYVSCYIYIYTYLYNTDNTMIISTEERTGAHRLIDNANDDNTNQ